MVKDIPVPLTSSSKCVHMAIGLQFLHQGLSSNPTISKGSFCARQGLFDRALNSDSLLKVIKSYYFLEIIYQYMPFFLSRKGSVLPLTYLLSEELETT